MRRFAVPLLMSALLVVSACGGSGGDDASDTKPTSPSTFDVEGVVTVNSDDVVIQGRSQCIQTSSDRFPECPAPAGTTCSVSEDSEFSAVRPGAQVTVSDAEGKAIGLGELGEGKTAFDSIEDYSGAPVACAFPIVVIAVPVSGTIYGIDIGNGETQKFTRAQAETVAITLGSPLPTANPSAGFVPTKEQAFAEVKKSVAYYRDMTLGEFDIDATVTCGTLQMFGAGGDVKAVEDELVNEGRTRKEAGIIIRAVSAAWCDEWFDAVASYYEK